MNSVGCSCRRVTAIAANTLREALRQRLLPVLALLAGALLLGARYFRDLHYGSSELKFLADLGGGAIALFGAVLAVGTTAQLLAGEVERRTVLTLLAKPVHRAEFVLGKFAGIAAITGGFCALLTALLAVVLWSRESELLSGGLTPARSLDYWQVAWLGGLHWLKLLVLVAHTLFVASYARTQLFVSVAGYLLLAAGHLQHFARAASERAGQPVAAALWRLLPDFQVFDPGLGGGHGWAELPARVVAYGAAQTTLACVLAVWCFQRREL